ncbi:hypothetical protein [Streptomyces fuscigenes]|uniref:hypothetical protein n=1 Tax=Streptomyces fuscigenes TaxID=1528880 RepID=UPI001F40E496|nr:hypothetical protein [Streptomyces fuscigenes]MCF3961621.1 hypothetical protein [Streptomyces fuscigenes]
MTFRVPAADRAAVVEQLRTRAFPEQRTRTEGIVSAPSFHWAELGGTALWEGDVADAEERKGCLDAECQGLVRALARKWEAEPETFGLMSLLMRDAGGEELPEPWDLLGRSVPELNVWHVEGRWIGIGVSGLAQDHEQALIAVVTGTDPP